MFGKAQGIFRLARLSLEGLEDRTVPSAGYLQDGMLLAQAVSADGGGGDSHPSASRSPSAPDDSGDGKSDSGNAVQTSAVSQSDSPGMKSEDTPAAATDTPDKPDPINSNDGQSTDGKDSQQKGPSSPPVAGSAGEKEASGTGDTGQAIGGGHVPGVTGKTGGSQGLDRSVSGAAPPAPTNAEEPSNDTSPHVDEELTSAGGGSAAATAGNARPSSAVLAAVPAEHSAGRTDGSTEGSPAPARPSVGETTVSTTVPVVVNAAGNGSELRHDERPSGSVNSDELFAAAGVTSTVEEDIASADGAIPQPHASDLLTAMPALNVALIEEKLQVLLGRVEAVGEQVSDALFRTGAVNSWLLVGATAVLACEMARRQARKTAPILVATGPDLPSSRWSLDDA